jgi:flagellar biosynthetic protein FliR/type III secretion protein T
VTALLPSIDGLIPELLGAALVSMRLLPVALLCPLLGGQLAPTQVRLAIALCLALALRPLAGPSPADGPVLWAKFACEAGVGLTIGLAASLPFDAARVSGRLIDLVRGTSAEAALPIAGHREAATGDLLHQWILCLALASGALPALVRALARSYLLLPLGAAGLEQEGAVALGRLVCLALATGLSIAAPVLALAWATDAALALVARAAPGLPTHDLAAPVRILGGAGVLWLSLGLVADRLLQWVADAPLSWTALLGGRR